MLKPSKALCSLKDESRNIWNVLVNKEDVSIQELRKAYDRLLAFKDILAWSVKNNYFSYNMYREIVNISRNLKGIEREGRLRGSKSRARECLKIIEPYLEECYRRENERLANIEGLISKYMSNNYI